MSVSLAVDGSPAGCRNAAADLRTLREEVDAASTMLARSMITAAGAWSGSSSDEFTEFVKERIHRADDLSDELLLLATGLEGLGLGLAEVKSEVRRARGIAARADIPVGSHLPEPGELVLEPGQEGPLDHAVGVATRAKEHEIRLQTAWQELLGRTMKLTWDPAEINVLAASAGKGLDSSSPGLGDLVPDLPDVNVPDLGSLPLPVGPILEPLEGVLSGPAIPGIDLPDPGRLLEGLRQVAPNPPKLGPLPIFVMPSQLLALGAIKSVKRLRPDLKREIDVGIRQGTSIGMTTAAGVACAPLSAVGSVACGYGMGVVGDKVADEFVEMTDAK